MKEGDSAGGVIECIIRGMQARRGRSRLRKAERQPRQKLFCPSEQSRVSRSATASLWPEPAEAENNDPYAYTSDGIASKSWPTMPAASWAASATAAISFSGLPSSPRPPSPWNRIQSTRAVKISASGSKAVTTRSSFRELLSWWKPWPPSRFSICFLQASRPVWTI